MLIMSVRLCLCLSVFVIVEFKSVLGSASFVGLLPILAAFTFCYSLILLYIMANTSDDDDDVTYYCT